MNYQETLKKSINRVEKLVNDNLVLDKKGFPLPSWIELSPIDVCNRTCVFCPKADQSIAPDQNHVLPEVLYTKMAKELREIGFKGTIMLAGYGEPLLNKNISKMIQEFSNFCNVEITTNGDPLTISLIKSLYASGVKKIIVSMYDGEEQIKQFDDMFTQASITKEQYILRDRWYTKEENYGVKLTNRAGVLGNSNSITTNSKCYYPFYSMMVDWNGDVFLCTQDWNRRIKTGNLMLNTVLEVWTSNIINKYRKHLFEGNRDLPPCNRCDADGKLHGEEYAEIWKKNIDSFK